MTKKYFGTDGIRGTVNKGNINGDMFFKFGLAAGTYFKNQKKNKQIAIIAKDTKHLLLFSIHMKHRKICRLNLVIKMNYWIYMIFLKRR